MYFQTLSYDLDPGFSRSNFEKVISQEWDGQLTWNERDVINYLDLFGIIGAIFNVRTFKFDTIVIVSIACDKSSCFL